MGDLQRRDWTFTLNAAAEGRLRTLKAWIHDGGRELTEEGEVWKLVQYLVCQLEKSDSGTKHLQGFIRLKGYKRAGRVQAILKSIFGIAPSRRALNSEIYDVEGCIKYATKEETRIDGPWEFGNKPIIRKRKKQYVKITDNITTMLRDGKSPYEIAKADLKAYWMYAQKIEYAYAKLKEYQYWRQERKDTPHGGPSLNAGVGNNPSSDYLDEEE